MSGLATQPLLRRSLAVPFNLAEATLAAGQVLQVHALNLAAGQSLRCRWLSLHLLRVRTSGAPAQVNPGLGSAYVGLYGSEAALAGQAPGTPLALAQALVPGVADAESGVWYREFTNPDLYTVLVVNNLNCPVDVAVLGLLRVTLPN